jgi:hypothetical protein
MNKFFENKKQNADNILITKMQKLVTSEQNFENKKQNMI